MVYACKAAVGAVHTWLCYACRVILPFGALHAALQAWASLYRQLFWTSIGWVTSRYDNLTKLLFHQLTLEHRQGRKAHDRVLAKGTVCPTDSLETGDVYVGGVAIDNQYMRHPSAHC